MIFWICAYRQYNQLHTTHDDDNCTVTIFEQRTTAQRDGAFKDLLPIFWIRPATWLHYAHEVAVSISWSLQCSWWGLALAETRQLCSGWLCVTSRPIFMEMWFADSSHIVCSWLHLYFQHNHHINMKVCNVRFTWKLKVQWCFSYNTGCTNERSTCINTM